MKLKIFFMILILPFLLNSYSFAEDFNSTEGILKLIQKNRENWVVRSNGIYYFHKKNIEDARNSTYPDMESGCMIDVSHSVFRENGYIIIEKPFNEHIRDKQYTKFAKAIRQLIYEELHNRHKIRMPKKKIKEPLPKIQEKTVEGSNKL